MLVLDRPFGHPKATSSRVGLVSYERFGPLGLTCGKTQYHVRQMDQEPFLSLMQFGLPRAQVNKNDFIKVPQKYFERDISNWIDENPMLGKVARVKLLRGHETASIEVAGFYVEFVMADGMPVCDDRDPIRERVAGDLIVLDKFFHDDHHDDFFTPIRSTEGDFGIKISKRVLNDVRRSLKPYCYRRELEIIHGFDDLGNIKRMASHLNKRMLQKRQKCVEHLSIIAEGDLSISGGFGSFRNIRDGFLHD